MSLIDKLAFELARRQTAECVVVTEDMWRALILEGEAFAYVNVAPNPATRAQLVVAGVPVVQAWSAWPRLSFIEIHSRPAGYAAQIDRIEP